VGLETPDGWVEENDKMLEHAVDFYKSLFRKEPDSNISLGDDFWEENEKVTSVENELLTAPFTEEVRVALFSSYADGAPGPDGLPFLFYQVFWDTVKADLLNLVNSFENNNLNLERINYALITLIPKEPDAKILKKFRPISLLNCSFKLFSKLLNNRLMNVANRLIATNQTAFIKGRYILESVVAAHEIIHEINNQKETGLILKLDYEKAYDRVSWSFLKDMLTARGFSPKWISWILSTVQGGSIGIRINDENSVFFKPGKGLRQGDPLSPLLFNLVADVFSRMLIKAARQNLISGLLPQVMDGGVVSLQYADDTLLFLEANIEKAQTLKWLLVCFEEMSGMKINYDKSDLLTIGLSLENANEYAKVFCCKLSDFPIKYLGVPLHFTKLRRVDIQPVIDKIIKRIAGWRGRLLSYAGRLTLLRACLASIPIYLLSIIKFPRWAIDMINSQMGHFLWNNNEDKQRYRLANWQLVAQKKDFGGLGIPDLRSLNLALLCSWIFRYQLNNNVIWAQILDFKYRSNNPNIFCCSEVGASPF
jgi:hypothetical protein